MPPENCHDVDDLIELARKFPQPWLADLGGALIDASPGGSIRDVQKLIALGLVRRPESEAYVLGLMQLFSSHWIKTTSIDAQLKADPGLSARSCCGFSRLQGTPDVSLAALDKYQRGRVSLAQAGRSTRASAASIHSRRAHRQGARRTGAWLEPNPVPDGSRVFTSCWRLPSKRWRLAHRVTLRCYAAARRPRSASRSTA